MPLLLDPLLPLAGLTATLTLEGGDRYLFDYALWSYLDENLDFPLYPRRLPQDEPGPAFVMQRILSDRTRTLQGPTALVTARIQISAWSHDNDDVIDMTDRLRTLMDGFTGNFSGVPVRNVILDNERELAFADTGLGDDQGWFGRMSEYIVMYGEG